MSTFHLTTIERLGKELLSHILPTDAIDKGYSLDSYDQKIFYYQKIFVVLTKCGWEVYRWEYIPSMTEVWEKIKEVEGEL